MSCKHSRDFACVYVYGAVCDRYLIRMSVRSGVLVGVLWCVCCACLMRGVWCRCCYHCMIRLACDVLWVQLILLGILCSSDYKFKQMCYTHSDTTFKHMSAQGKPCTFLKQGSAKSLRRKQFCIFFTDSFLVTKKQCTVAPSPLRLKWREMANDIGQIQQWPDFWVLVSP